MRFLFIVGCGHSGTSLMLALFANCEGVNAITSETEALIRSSLKEFKMKFKTLDNISSKLVVEKTPRHVYRLGDITSDKDSYALVMLRNPIDVVASLKKRGYSLMDSIARYQRDNNAWLNYESQKRVKILKYEDLVIKTEQVLDDLGREYGVDLISANGKRLADERIFFTKRGELDRKIKPEINQTDGRGINNHLSLRNFQIRQEIKNMNGQWKERLTERELISVIEKLTPLIRRFKYEECFDYKI